MANVVIMANLSSWICFLFVLYLLLKDNILHNDQYMKIVPFKMIIIMIRFRSNKAVLK